MKRVQYLGEVCSCIVMHIRRCTGVMMGHITSSQAYLDRRFRSPWLSIS